MGISDIIERYLKEMFQTAEEIQIKRNDIASKFNCVPSQINYVISTRFNPENGFIVESRRGGGGGITIRKICFSEQDYLRYLIRHIGASIKQSEAGNYIGKMFEEGLITKREASIMFAAVSDNSLPSDTFQKDALRAKTLKNMIMNII